MEKNNLKKGFTIVELLIVIVVIGILAAITVVSYTGITAKANTASAQSAANNVVSKALAYNAEGLANAWPINLTDLTGSTGTSYALVGVNNWTTAATNTVPTSAPTSSSYVSMWMCGTNGTATAPTTTAGMTTRTGVKVYYWDYTQASAQSVAGGTTTGNYGGWAVGCAASGS